MELLKNDCIKDTYDLYDLVKTNHPSEFLNKWHYTEHILSTKKTKRYIATRQWMCMKEVDKETFYMLYNKLYNPITITLRCKTGAPIIYNENNELLYSLYISLESIDDTCYKVLIDNVPESVYDNLILKLIDYFDNTKIINYREFLDYGIYILNGTDESY